MPVWAQYLGEILPLIHFLRVVRGILLKGNEASDVVAHLLPIGFFLVLVLSLAIKRYRQTLD
jgi:ABC-2 type transport system permease protein